MALVVDASVAGAWLLPGERSEKSNEILRRVYREETYASSIFHLEVANLILQASKRGRVPEWELDLMVEDVGRLRIRLEAPRLPETLALAQDYSLSVYDASYLEIAIRKSATLATFDQKLRTIARQLSVPLCE